MNGRDLNLPPFPASYRASGLLLHVTSLPSLYGIGDVGPAAIAWIDRLSDAGQSWWQSLPLGPTGYGNSPYQPLSSFAGNDLLISPDWLIEDSLLSPSDCVAPRSSASSVDYNAVIQFKHRLLETAWSNFVEAECVELRVAFDQFCHEQAHWLEDHALFCALKRRYKALTSSNGQPSWFSVCRKLWLRLGMIWRIRSIKFALRNFYCFARERGFRNMVKQKVCE